MRYLLLVTLTAVLLPGCGGGGGGGGAADTTGPTIANLTAPSPADSNGGTVTISAQVTDTSGVGTVTATVTKPDNSTATVSMTASGGTYSGTFAASANTTATAESYSVVVTATDAGGRSSTSSPVAFAVPAQNTPPDTTGPTIAGLSAPSPADFSGGTVTISADVTDPSGVASVSAAVTLPDNSTTTVNLTASGSTYSGTFAAAANSGTSDASYSVVATATDTAGNVTTSSAVAVTVPTPFITTASGLRYWDFTTGVGAAAAVGNLVTVHYTGWLADGTIFDSSRRPGRTPFTFRLGTGQVIAGWDEGVQGVKVGGVRRLVIPPNLGYGSTPVGSIPPNSTLYFEVEMLSISN